MKFGLFRRKFGKYVLAGIAIFLCSIISYFVCIRFCTIRIIEVVSNDVRVVVDEKKISKNLLFFPSEKFRSEILRDNPLLTDVRFEKVYPYTLKILPILREPFASLHSEDRIVLIDRGGVVLQDGDRGLSLPLMFLNLGPFHVGEKLTDAKVIFLLGFMDGLKETLTINTITEIDSAYYLVKTNKTDIYITQDKPLGETMATLQTLIAGFRIKGTLPAVVDLRFDKPIVKI